MNLPGLFWIVPQAAGAQFLLRQSAGSLNLALSQNYLYYKPEYWRVYKTISKHKYKICSSFTNSSTIIQNAIQWFIPLSEFNFLTTEFVVKIKTKQAIVIPVELNTVPALVMSAWKGDLLNTADSPIRIFQFFTGFAIKVLGAVTNMN